jgi:hypothetical protein
LREPFGSQGTSQRGIEPDHVGWRMQIHQSIGRLDGGLGTPAIGRPSREADCEPLLLQCRKAFPVPPTETVESPNPRHFPTRIRANTLVAVSPPCSLPANTSPCRTIRMTNLLTNLLLSRGFHVVASEHLPRSDSWSLQWQEHVHRNPFVFPKKTRGIAGFFSPARRSVGTDVLRRLRPSLRQPPRPRACWPPRVRRQRQIHRARWSRT